MIDGSFPSGSSPGSQVLPRVAPKRNRGRVSFGRANLTSRGWSRPYSAQLPELPLEAPSRRTRTGGACPSMSGRVAVPTRACDQPRMKRGGILRLLIGACMAMALLTAPHASARLGASHPTNGSSVVGAAKHAATRMAGPMDCCPTKRKPASRPCPECPLMALCSSPCIDQTRTADVVRPTHRVVALATPDDERDRSDHAPPPLRKPPRSQG